jgi:uncharacterized membrane protein YccC
MERKEYPMSTPTTFQAALARHHAALADRAEVLAQQFQVLTQLLNATDPQSPEYPRRLNLLLRLHKALQAFDPDPADQQPEPASANDPNPSRPEHPDSPPPTPQEPSSPPIQNPKSKIQNKNHPPDVRRAFMEKLAS